MDIKVAGPITAEVVEGPDRTITVQPGKIHSFAVPGRSAEYSYSKVDRQAWPLPMIDSPRWEGSGSGRSWTQWLIEPLTNQPTGLFNGVPMLCHRRDGSVFTRWAYNQSGNTIEEAHRDYVLGTFRPVVFEGKRNLNATTGYTTYQADPLHNGWWGLDKITGWIFHIHGDGGIWTAAGDETPVEDGKIYAGEYKRTGIFDRFWGLTTDFRMFPGDNRRLFVCDNGNNRITLTTWTRANGITTAKTETFAEIPGVYSFDIRPDGSMAAVARTSGKLYEITPGGSVSERASGLTDAHRIRFNSTGQIVWARLTAKNIYHYDGTNHRVIANIAGASQAWWELDIDVTGSVGPIDDILCNVAHTTPATPIRVSFDGSYKSIAPTGGPLRTGRTNIAGYGNAIRDSALHYGWAIAIHPLTARFILAGFGDMAHTVWRRVRSTDPNAFNSAAYTRGRSQHQYGDSNFTSAQNLHGPSGFSYTGLKNFDELAFFSDSDLNNYITSGMEGSLPQRLFTADQLRDYRYYIRINSVRSLTEKIVY